MGRAVAGEPGLPERTTEQATKLACLTAKPGRNSYHARPRRPPSLRAAAGSLARGQAAMMRFTLCEPSAHRYQAAQGLNTVYQTFYTAVEGNAALSLSLRVLVRARLVAPARRAVRCATANAPCAVGRTRILEKQSV